ncbi:rRNA N6-adenosine-methyltransferase METTL5-like [Argiope bruennichi]|uniref:rRNA N6-adenosine-methyltransferase METTL5-like n=1 Tax=Argiope bruennichi TaxID=94029 RepID=UPI0024943D1E|nr:rRNA N6-adenosine-methyltransferase METTL5-like [Argiope bruennichi]
MLKFQHKKVKKLQQILDTLDVFEKPNVALEQYPTPPHIAAHMLHIMSENTGEVEDRMVADLGCGCGTLTIAAAICGASMCVGFDIDPNALEIAQRNKEDMELKNIDFILCDVQDLSVSKWQKTFDTVILNPPFGTKHNKGIDIMFLQTALRLARHTVYSLHKSTTIEYIGRKAKQWNVKMEPLYEMVFNISKSRTTHKKESQDIPVHLIRFTFPSVIKKS